MPDTTHRFSVSHYNESDFKRNGLRAHAEYRDLGIAEATGGMVGAHVIRPVLGRDVEKEPSTRHAHDVQFQLLYCLKGWIKTEFAGHGAHVMRAGSCWLQPAGIAHKVLAESDDFELLEINMPATFATVETEVE
jgi:mannose-6-phosphate isomerase-like protein (cupin superfamily)